jgi:hypothetical protein
MRSSKLFRRLGNFFYTSSLVLVIASMVTNSVLACYQARATVTLGACTWTALNGSQTSVVIDVTGAALTINGQTYTSDTTISLPPGTYPYTWAANQYDYQGSGSGSITVGSCVPGFQLNISHINCVPGSDLVEIHFVLLNVPDGVTPGTLTYTYGTIEPGDHTGNVWHYTDYKPSGTYNITSASVVVGPETITLHNPGAYAGSYLCGSPASANVILGACTWSAGTGSQTPVTINLTGADLSINGVTYSASTTINLSPGTYNYTWTAQAGYYGSGSGSVTVNDCTPPDASASVSLGACSWSVGAGSQTPVTISLAGADLTINGTTYSTSTIINLPPGSYPYTWTAQAGFKGSGSGTLEVGDCTPPDASASAVLGACTWSVEDGSVTPVTITVAGASLFLNGVTYTASGTVDLAPGSYPYTWTALPGYKGSGSGTLVVSECTPPDGSASVSAGACSWSPASGSQTPVNITIDHATLTINGSSYTASTSINLPPGTYPYTWVAAPGYKGSGLGALNINDCTPPDGSASVAAGACTWTVEDGSLTPVTITIDHATLTINGATYFASDLINLAPGSYPYTWVAIPGYKGSGGGTLVISDCTPPDASASVALGACSWNEVDGALTPVTITIDHASLIINGVTYTVSDVVNLAPGSYPYTWAAVAGYKGSGSGTLVVADCTPGLATASVETGACSWTVEDGSLTPVSITLDHASFIINSVMYTSSTNINLAPGSYPYSWTALPGYRGSGSGTLEIGACVPPPVPSVGVSCYSLEFHSYRINIGNTGPAAGEIGYSTNLDANIVSLGVIASGGTTQIHVPLAVTSLNVYPMEATGWGTAIVVPLSTETLGICEDPLGLNPFCSYVDLGLPHGWTVNNINTFPVEFTWTYGSESSSAPIPLAGGASLDFFTADHSGAVMQIFVDGILMASAGPVVCPEFLGLSLDGICSSDPVTTNGWEATNPNPFSVSAEWRVNGSSLTGLLDIPAGGTAQFITPIGEGNIVQLYYGGIAQDDASAAVNCTPYNPPNNPPVQVQIPVTGGETQVLIPVTGLADDLAGMLPTTLFSLSIGSFGLGTLLKGLARKRNQKR